MAFRGRGRGRGRGGHSYAKEEPFELFPEIELPDRKNIPLDKSSVLVNSRLLRFWQNSPYYLRDEETARKNNRSMDIERYSDMIKPKTSSKRDLAQFLILNSNNFPEELIKDTKETRSQKRVRWNQDEGLQKMDIFEKLEQKEQDDDEKDDKEKKEGKDEKDGKEKKEGEDENEEDEEAIEEAEEEFSDDGDYNQNEYFDDDEDDYNMADEGADEPTF